MSGIQPRAPHKVRAEIAGRGISMTMAPGEIIFAQGDGADGIYYIAQGSIRLSAVSDGGKEVMLAILGEGSLFGHESLLDQAQRSLTASALTHCHIVRLDGAVVLSMLESDPAFAEFLTSDLVRWNAKAEEELSNVLANSSEKRLARLLLQLANIGSESTSEVTIPYITHERLAEMIGTTRSRISCFMSKFRRAGHIDYNGNILVRPSLSEILRKD